MAINDPRDHVKTDRTFGVYVDKEKLFNSLMEKWAADPSLQVGVPYRCMATDAVEVAAKCVVNSFDGVRATTAVMLESHRLPNEIGNNESI